MLNWILCLTWEWRCNSSSQRLLLHLAWCGQDCDGTQRGRYCWNCCNEYSQVLLFSVVCMYIISQEICHPLDKVQSFFFQVLKKVPTYLAIFTWFCHANLSKWSYGLNYIFRTNIMRKLLLVFKLFFFGAYTNFRILVSQRNWIIS